MSFVVDRLALGDVLLIRPRKLADARGYFMETYRASHFAELGIPFDVVQENQSRSVHRGTIRGFHFQRPPQTQAKLVRVLRGSIFDVVVDVRRDSPTFGRWVSATLTADTGEQLFVPQGFAHGFCTLEPETAVAYRIDAYYSPAHEEGIHFADSALGIVWPIGADKVVISERDARLPGLADVDPW